MQGKIRKNRNKEILLRHQILVLNHSLRFNIQLNVLRVLSRCEEVSFIDIYDNYCIHNAVRWMR